MKPPVPRNNFSLSRPPFPHTPTSAFNAHTYTHSHIHTRPYEHKQSATRGRFGIRRPSRSTSTKTFWSSSASHCRRFWYAARVRVRLAWPKAKSRFRGPSSRIDRSIAAFCRLRPLFAVGEVANVRSSDEWFTDCLSDRLVCADSRMFG